MKRFLHPRGVARGLVGAGIVLVVYAIWLPLRTVSDKVRCQSSLRQIGLATMQYTQDYDEKWMFAANWKGVLKPYFSLLQHPTGVSRLSCHKTARDYAYNIHFDGNRFAAVPNPASVALFYEPANAVNADGGQSWVTRGIHGDGSNVGFADGHVGWLRAKPVFWTSQLELQTQALARQAARDQAKQWHDYRAYLQKLKQKKSKS